MRRLQQDNYYAFGLRKSLSPVSESNKYLYNGKEIQSEFGNGIGEEQYDYGERFYDPIIGRWNVVDPLAEDYDDVSPYNYVLNDPVSNIDPDGTWVDNRPTGFASTTVDGTGKIIEHKNDGDNSVYQFVNGKKTRIGFEKLGVNYSELIGQQLTNSLFWVNNQLSDVEVKGLKKAIPDVSMVIPITAPTIGPGLGLVLPEKFIPGTRVVIMTANIIGFAIETSKNARVNPANKYKGLTGSQIISKFKLGKIRKVFPEQYNDVTWENIEKEANRGVSSARTARKLLNDSRFNK